MIKTNHLINQFQSLQTPFYFYDLLTLQATIFEIKHQIQGHPFAVHYALKANVNSSILKLIKEADFGADCVSGNEVQMAIDAGIDASKIVFAGVGKADWEIELGLDRDIFCFNVESIPELQVIDEIAKRKNKIAHIALRINPDVSADTHDYITTGKSENKFGIDISNLDAVMQIVKTAHNVKLIGIHLHIGSQITNMQPYIDLCHKINDLQLYFEEQNISLKHINVGGGLGVNYEQPDEYPITDFQSYFDIFKENLELRPTQIVHFELGRSIVAQCGSLISRVLYVKESSTKKFMILDAGMTELIRPALYQAYHKIENLTSNLPNETYDIVGPICETSDVFAKDYPINKTQRGDIIAIRTAGAYGETMASRYNMRDLPKAVTSEELLGAGC